MKKVLNLLYENVSLLVFGIIITYLCVTSFFNTCYISIDWNEYTFYLSDKPIRNLIVVLLILFVLCILKKTKMMNNINSNKKAFLIIKYTLLLIIFVAGTFWVLNTRLFPAADQYSVQKSVSEFFAGNYDSAISNGYINNNFQQRGLFVLSYLFALFFGDMNIIALEMVNVIATVFIFKSLSEIVGIYKGTYSMQLFVVACGIFFPIVVLYSYFIYGNIVGLAFSLLAIKYELLFIEENKVTNVLLSSIFILLGMLCKSTYQIYFIAMLICLVFNLINKYELKKIIYLGLLIISFLLSSLMPTRFIENKTSIKMSEGLSFYSYIAMGLQESNKAPGWYNGFNHDSYVACNNDTKKHKEYSKIEIEKRIGMFANNLDYADEFFTKKIVSEWNNPTYQVFWNIQDKYSKDYYPKEYIRSFLSLNNTYKIQKYLNMLDSIIKLGALLYVFYLIFNKINENLILPITFVGGFLFLSFLSEAKAQYAIIFSTLLIPIATMGYNYVANLIVEKRCSFKTKKATIIIFVLFILFTCINIANKSFLSKDDDLYYKYISENGDFDYINPPEYY